jgi:tRNA A37 threonylcarbamoyladenosine synthetase subunit TsaC/SUA5/YrdC
MAPFPVLSSKKRPDRHRAAQIVTDGAVIGASFGTVYGLIGDGDSTGLGEKIAQIKGQERIGRPLSVCLPARRFSQLLDPAQIHPKVRDLALDGHALSRTLSSLAFVRAPIRASAAQDLPKDLVSYVDSIPYLQSLDPSGLPRVRSLMSHLWRHGVPLPAITSMNRSGEPEIVTQVEAQSFATTHQLGALMAPGPGAKRASGSLTILEVGPFGLRAARHGVIPIEVLHRLVVPRIDDTITQQADFPPLDIVPSTFVGLNHDAICRAALLSLNTSLPSGVVRQIARVGLGHPWHILQLSRQSGP